MTEHRSPGILLLGAFPPQAQGIPGYCGALAAALSERGPVQALGFKAMYPRWLFPGVKAAMDPTSGLPDTENLTVRHALAWYNPVGWLWHAWRTPADVVHIQWWSLPLFPVCLTFAIVARLRGKPVVVTVHNVLPHESSPWFLGASRLLCRQARHVIVHSEANRRQFLEHFNPDPDRVSCIPMGVDAAAAPLAAPEAARRSLGVPADRPTLLFFGTIRPYKGLGDLLRSLAIVRATHPAVQLLIAGKPWAPWAPYQAIIDALGLGDCVHTALDYIPEAEVSTWCAAADLVVLPYTHFDAQSAVGAQVLAAGRPLIVTDTGGLPELVGHDPRWIAPPNDPETLALKLTEFLDDPEDGNRAFTAIAAATHSRMSWGKSAEAHWAVYEAVGCRL